MLTNESFSAYLDSLPWSYDEYDHLEWVKLSEIGKDSILMMTLVHSMPKFKLEGKSYVVESNLLKRRHENLPRRVKPSKQTYSVTKLNLVEMIKQ